MQEHRHLRQATWRKSNNSGDGNCVEVATTPTVIGVRDSKDVPGPFLAFDPASWIEFVNGVKDGEFDLR